MGESPLTIRTNAGFCLYPLSLPGIVFAEVDGDFYGESPLTIRTES